MRLTLKDHRDAMVAMLANGNCPTSAARLAHAMHDVLSYLQSEPEAPVSHSERRAEATTPGLNDRLLALDLEAHRKPQTANQQVKELQSTVKHRDNTIKQLKENIQLLRDERAELTRQLEEALAHAEFLQECLSTHYAPDNEQLTPEQIETIRQASPASSLPDANFTNELFPSGSNGKGLVGDVMRNVAQSGVRKEDTELPWIEWGGGGECPVSENAVIDIRFRDGSVRLKDDAHWLWWHAGNGYDIIAYRVVKP